MKAEPRIKLAVDFLMTLLLFILYHLLNFGWYRNLSREKYTAVRLLICVTDLALLAAMIRHSQYPEIAYKLCNRL